MTTSTMFVTYNRLELTKQMVSSLLKNTDSPFRIIIVDNGSSDGSVEWLGKLPWQENKFCLSYDLHLFPENKGIAIGRNQALKIADKYNDEWLSTLDNDIVLPEAWLSSCLDVLVANPNFAIGINLEGVSYPLETINNKTIQRKDAGNLGTCCTVFNRDLHNKIGFFITEFGLYAHEDADFFFRARMAGYQMGYLPTAGVHLGEGEADKGVYREFKTESSKKYIGNFNKNCYEYMRGQRNIYVPFD